jgi:hypothetical protein
MTILKNINGTRSWSVYGTNPQFTTRVRTWNTWNNGNSLLSITSLSKWNGLATTSLILTREISSSSLGCEKAHLDRGFW